MQAREPPSIELSGDERSHRSQADENSITLSRIDVILAEPWSHMDLDATATTISQDRDRAQALERAAHPFFRPKENSEAQVILRCRRLRQPWRAWISAAAATTITGVTTFYWFASIPRDLHSILLSDSMWTVFILSFLSLVTGLTLKTLSDKACNNLRWSYCIRENGLSLLDFVVLSPVISPIRLIRLLKESKQGAINGKNGIINKIRHTSHRLWAIQR
jgi:hypothetical protein